MNELNVLIDLQYLSFHVVFTFEERMESTRVLLFDIFKLNTLKVKTLRLRDYVGRMEDHFPMVRMN